MEDSPIHLFDDKPIRQQQPADVSKEKKGVTIPLPFSLLLIPLLFIAAGISIPVTYVKRFLQFRSEKRFAGVMLAANKTMNWDNFENAIKEKQGTAICESLAPKGPFRLWWTEDDIPAVCPHKYERGHHFAVWDSEFEPFFRWCRSVYTDPQAGSAKLVLVPDVHRRQLRAKLEGARYVSTCSFKNRLTEVDSN